ncbi:MAG: luciferase-like protein [Bradyrhizobium sp.]|nr:luciferase-like protein [Bradyrhizobium sp.]
MLDPNLRHGVFLPPFHLEDSDPTLSYHQDLEIAEFVDKLGYHELWVGEHHSGGTETISSPELYIAAAAERTKNIRLGTGVVSLPYHNPLMVANRIIQLDHHTRGRIMFGAGPGLLASDATMLGIAPAKQRDRMEEALDVILRLFDGEVVTEKTEWYDLQAARVHLLPYSRPRPEISVASAMTPSGGRLAGKYGLGLLCVAAASSQGYDTLAANWAIANEIAAENGHVMDTQQLRLVAPVHIAETREMARAEVREGIKRYVDYMNNNAPRFIFPEGTDLVQWWIDEKLGVIGTPDDAIAYIERLQDKQGRFGCFLHQATGMADFAATKRSYELFAAYVFPHFSGANAARWASYDWTTQKRTEFSALRKEAVDQMFDKHNAEREEKTGRTLSNSGKLGTIG